MTEDESMTKKWVVNVRKMRCLFSLYHQWGEPIVEQNRIIHVCQRCGKRSEHLLSPKQSED